MKALTKVSSFLMEVKEELKQVSWPSREELVGAVIVVFVGVFFLASYIGVCDLVLSNAARLLLR